jgi:shikimate dehydrogenase
MRLGCIIGYPIGHSLSPTIYNAAFEALGIEARFEAWSTPPEELKGAIQRLRSPEMLGMSVTVPHKEAVIPLLDAVQPAAQAIGAVNCVVKDGARLIGHNTDREGFLRSLRECGFEPEGASVLILGAGGVAHAVAYGLAETGVASIAFAGRTPQRVAATAAHLRAVAPSTLRIEELRWHDEPFGAACREVDLIVNCTPLGMSRTDSEGQSPLLPEHLRPGVYVFDTVYTPLQTALLRQARSALARPVGGLDMLVYQAAACLKLWLGREAPIDIMREAARRVLETA